MPLGAPFRGLVLAWSGRLLLFRTVIYRSCQTRRQGTQAEGALPATVAPAGEVRGTGRQARPFLFGGVGNLLRITAAKPLGEQVAQIRPTRRPTSGRSRWFRFRAAMLTHDGAAVPYFPSTPD